VVGSRAPTNNEVIVLRIEVTNGNAHEVWLTDGETEDRRRVTNGQRDDIGVHTGGCTFVPIFATSESGEFRQFGTATSISSVAVPGVVGEGHERQRWEAT